MEDGLRQIQICCLSATLKVLILVVMEDGLRRGVKYICNAFSLRLNPCCNGRWSQTLKDRAGLGPNLS